MKKVVAAIAAVIALVLIGATAFSMGVRDGIRRAIEESRIFVENDTVIVDFEGNFYVHNGRK